MKKTISVLVLICVLLVSLTVSASAQTVAPVFPEALRQLVAGKTFIASANGFVCNEEMDHVTLYFQICEQESYTAEEVEALQPGDTIIVGGEEFKIKEIKQDEFGYEFVGELYAIFVTKNEKGLYNAVTDTENRFYRNLFAIEVPAPSDMVFLDWSDPEAEAPTELTLKDYVNRYMNDEINSTPDNTEITFDENGNLTAVTYRYSPWN
ncbi:MAG: hypothetical protein Q4G00_12060 [Clostridia bacterium]|nr:hypothetical protein [Clostridia bacterium]